MKVSPLLGCIALCATQLSPAAPVNSKIIGADAQWALHLDLASFRDSKAGKEAVDAGLKYQEQHSNASIQLDLGKLLTTIGSITAYGANFSPDAQQLDGVLIVQGTPELRKIVEAYLVQATVSQPDDVTELKDLGMPGYSAKGQVVIAFPGDSTVMVSKSRAQVQKAYSVMRGEAANLTQAKSSAIRRLIESTPERFLHVATVVPEISHLPEGAPQARILQMARIAGLTLGEQADKTALHLELVAASDEMADKLLKIVQGLTAMASLAESNDKQLNEFLQSLAVKREARSVTLDLAYSTDRLVEMAKSAGARRQNAPRPNHPPKAEGRVVAEWVADEELGDAGPGEKTFVDHTIEHVALKQGSTVILTGRRNEGENARLDRVEIIPSAGGQPLRFEAEAMLLSGYEREAAPAASGGKLISAKRGTATARFQFPAEDGSYTVKVRYVDENDGKAKFTVSIKDPDTQ